MVGVPGLFEGLQVEPSLMQYFGNVVLGTLPVLTPPKCIWYHAREGKYAIIKLERDGGELLPVTFEFSRHGTYISFSMASNLGFV